MNVLCLAGPTGTGKSHLALRAAEKFHGAIINADSRQVYRDFAIITARPAPEDEARCPHRLYGFLNTQEKISAGTWAQLALTQIETLQKEGFLPILTGGTGLYLRAILDGIVDIPNIPPEISTRLLRQCAQNGPESLYSSLQEIDPLYAARVHPRDRQRIVRALEVHAATGKTFSWWHAQTPPPPPLRVLRIGLGLPLDQLTPLLEQRIRRMLENGALDEAAHAWERCSDPQAPGWSGIGCSELSAVLRGELTLQQAVFLWMKHTRAYAKRQLTWFRADPHIHWFTPETASEVLPLIDAWLSDTSRHPENKHKPQPVYKNPLHE